MINIRNKALVSIKEKEGIGLKKVVLYAIWQPACIAIPNSQIDLTKDVSVHSERASLPHINRPFKGTSKNPPISLQSCNI